MKTGQMRNFLIVLLLIATSFAGLLFVSSSEADGLGPSYYHNGYIHLNVTKHDGSPAQGYRIYWSGNHGGGGPWTEIDPTGEGTLNLTFYQIGEGTLKIRNLTMKSVHAEIVHVDPDEHVYLNISLPPPQEPMNVITGIVRNGTSLAPMSGIEIRLSTQDDIGEGISIYNTTGTDGRYRFEIVNISHYMVSLYSPSTSWHQSISGRLFLREGVHHYDLDLYAYPFFEGDLTSSIRFVTQNSDPIPGYVSVSTLAVDNAYSYFSSDHTGPDANGWINYTTSYGESYAHLNPNPKLLPKTYMYITYYFLQNGTPLKNEVTVDLSLFVPVEIDVWNSSGPVPGASIYHHHYGEEDFGKYSFEYSNGTDVNGSAILFVPKGGTYNLGISRVNHGYVNTQIDTTGPGPFSINITLVESEPPVIPPKATVNITLIDDESGLRVPSVRLYGSGNYDGQYYSFDGYTDSNGVLSMTVDAIVYYSIYANFNLAQGRIEDVEIIPGEPNNLTIKMLRHEMIERTESKPYHFYVVDEDGEPVPGLTLKISARYKYNSYYSTELVSDQNGRIDLVHVPETEMKISSDYYIPPGKWNPYAVRMRTYNPTSSETRLPDVVAYPSPEPIAITGVIRDSASMEPFRFQQVWCRSVKPLEPSRMMGPIRADYLDGIEFMDINRYSNSDGFYRIHGTETAVLEVHREGYFVYMEEVRIDPTRADVVHDILLDPLPETLAWLNGTLLDQDGSPISGELNITDIDHPGEIGHDIMINETGKFSIALYPSSYRLRFFNETLDDSMDIELTADGIEDLDLMLIPYSKISGKVLDWEGEPVGGINVTLLEEVQDALILVDWFITETDGNFSFMVERGTYEIDILPSELYGHYVVHDIEVNGWDDWYSHLYILNRTQADVSGTVLGSEGPFADGVPGVVVTLMDNTTEVASTTTESDGGFLLRNVNYGTYTLIADPPENLKPVAGIRSGYEMNQTEGFIVTGALVTVDPILKYMVNIPPENVTIEHHAPTGTGAYLDELITIGFSHVMDRSTVEDAFSILPEVANITFNWDEWGKVVTIEHDAFLPNTTYFVTLSMSLVSWEGYPMEGDDPFVWNFTTGNTTDPWTITSADVFIDGMELSVEVEAPPGQTIFIAISDIGYFQLVEGADGEYGIIIAEENFEYETTYSYFFTGELNGIDKAPNLSGAFTTPDAPAPEWEITDAEVTILSGGDWKVRVEGNPGLDIYIVIEGVGSFKLLEGAPGDYAINVNYTEFEKGKSYKYHFSDTEGGDDLAEDWSGTGTDPRGDTTVDETPWGLIIILIIIIVLLIIGIIIVALVLANRKKEEEEDWGDEE